MKNIFGHILKQKLKVRRSKKKKHFTIFTKIGGRLSSNPLPLLLHFVCVT